MRKFSLLLGLVALTASGSLLADTLVIEKVRRDLEAPIARPDRGLTMGQVERQFGEPEARTGAVGEPPITRWSYPGYTVYFEHDRVIHTVIEP